MRLDEIISALAASDKPDGRINAFLTCMFHLKGNRPAEPDDFDGKYGYQPSNIKTEHGFLMAHPYTSNLDEARGLVETILPGHDWHLSKVRDQMGGLRYSSVIPSISEPGSILGQAHSVHAALALTLAGLRAYSAIGGGIDAKS